MPRLSVAPTMGTPRGRRGRQKVAPPLVFTGVEAAHRNLAPVIDRVRALEHDVSRERRWKDGVQVQEFAVEMNERMKTGSGKPSTDHFPAIVD